MTIPDSVWHLLRMGLVAAGSWLVATGKVPMFNVEYVADQIIQILGAIIVVVTAAWGLYVTFRTKAVPDVVVQQDPSIPVVSPVTGAIAPSIKINA